MQFAFQTTPATSSSPDGAARPSAELPPPKLAGAGAAIGAAATAAGAGVWSGEGVGVRLYKILIYFTALLWESIIRLAPPPPAQPALLQYCCTTIAQINPPVPALPSALPLPPPGPESGVKRLQSGFRG